MMKAAVWVGCVAAAVLIWALFFALIGAWHANKIAVNIMSVLGLLSLFLMAWAGLWEFLERPLDDEED